MASPMAQKAMRLCFLHPVHDPGAGGVGRSQDHGNQQDLHDGAGRLGILITHPQADEGVSAEEQRSFDGERNNQRRPGAMNQQAAQVLETFLRLRRCWPAG